ncbi:MAG: ABC transporter permease [Isosphaeraceae bacterium]|nr:ABC transporter permease [Isosphaeraceae bacterium]
MTSLLDRIESFGRFASFAATVFVSCLVSGHKRLGEFLRQFERVALGSLALVALAGVSIGAVTWIQTHRLLADYGFEANLPSVLAVAVLVETGPILASLLVAGRLGAGLAAELGSMTLTEEIDARTAMGTPIIPTLVVPRVLACALALPFLTVLIDASALLGGLIAELAAGTLSAETYARRSLDFLRLSDIVPSTLKTALFGAVIGLVGCWTGLQADRSTEAVGKAATRGVVRAMLAVFGLNLMIVPMIRFVVAWSGWDG